MSMHHTEIIPDRVKDSHFGRAGQVWQETKVSREARGQDLSSILKRTKQKKNHSAEPWRYVLQCNCYVVVE